MNRLAVLLFALFSALVVSQPAWAQGGHGADATRGVVWAEGFEAAPTGALHRLETSVGTWSAPEGHATVHGEHRRSGARSLRMLGGEDRQVELQLPETSDKALELSFWAERWTARGPFVFRVLGEVDGQWQELYNGDERIKVGGFDTLVRVALPAGLQKLRMVSTSPAGTGVMLDDLRVHEPVPMQIESITTEQPVYPALIGNRTNPIARVVIRTTGSLEPITVETLRINTRGTTDLGDLEAVEVYYTGVKAALDYDYPDANFPDSARFGSAQSPGETIVVRGQQALAEGVNYFWVSYRLKDSANIDHRLDAGCEAVGLAGSHDTLEPTIVNPEGSQRMGVALRNADDDGIRAYRIPGLATTNEGTLIAVYDNRNRGWGDLPGDIDVGMSRSTDGGRTWEPMQTIMDMGNEDQPGVRGNGIGDPAVLVDRATNTIFVTALWSLGNRGWNGSGPGISPDQTGQFVLVKSEDDGKTWSGPINITEQIKQHDWRLLLQGPGKGITMQDGTLVFPAQFRDAAGLPHSTVIFSKDHGETWDIGTGAWPDTTEAQVVELENGKLMLNCRYNRQNRRVVMTTTDLGQTWQEHPSTRSALTEPGACMASLINVDQELGRDYRGLLLFSNPASLTSRSEMTIRASADGGLTWPESATVMLDQGQSAGYSCMTMIDDQTVGILYEGNRAHMTFQRVPLKDFTATLNRGE